MYKAANRLISAYRGKAKAISISIAAISISIIGITAKESTKGAIAIRLPIAVVAALIIVAY